jgi:hypothetical protein
MTDELPFAPIEQPNPPPRPSRTAETIYCDVARKLLPEVMDWLKQDGSRHDEARVLDDLAEAIENCDERDGYHIARYLERKGWACDFELCEMLDRADYLVYLEHENLVRAWVKASGITPKLKIGDVVSTPHVGVGPIVGINPELAQYIVATDKFLAELPDQAGKGTGYLIPFEDVKLMEEANAADAPAA